MGLWFVVTTQVLEYKTNPFKGVIPSPAALPKQPEEFRRQLRNSLDAWRGEGFRVVWIELSTSQAPLIPVAVEAGFSFHHTGEDYIMLTCRLEEGAMIPPYASHYIGVGGVVVTENGYLLVVREKYGFGGRPPLLKLPGGAIHAGEHLVDGVIREVLEETGVNTNFEALGCFRHWHGYRYGKSDIYFVCRLRPLSLEITMQTSELDECLWMPVDSFLSADDISVFNKEIVTAALESPGLAPRFVSGYDDPEKREFFMPLGGPGGV